MTSAARVVGSPRIEVDLAAIEHNARVLVDLLAPKGIGVTGVTKAALGSPAVADAMARGGVGGFGDSRVANLERLGTCHGLAGGVPTTLIRSPMLSQVDRVVRAATRSLNTERAVLDALSAAAGRARLIHGVVLMVELGDLREGVAADAVVDLAGFVLEQPNLELVGIGTNLACQSGVVPDQAKMDELSELADAVDRRFGSELAVVSGGNSANLEWALAASDVGRIDDLRLGEAIMLGCEPLHRRPLPGLRTDAFTLVAEVIERQDKVAEPWGTIAQGAFGAVRSRPASGSAGSGATVRQAILSVGRQDVDPDGLTSPEGIRILGTSSDHLVVDAGDVELSVGVEVRFGLGYGALARAMASPFVTQVFRGDGPPA
jgi:predicted amino acid racemase